MLACGPYTVNNELSFEALKDLMAIVNRDKPHVLIMSGPFVSCGHEDVMSGDLRYRDLETGELCFMDYNQLFEEIMNYIYKNVDASTELVLVPSVQEISHFYPMPQPPMPTSMFDGTKMRVQNRMPHLVSNPGMFSINEVTFGFVNTDVVKDMCVNMVVKNSADG